MPSLKMTSYKPTFLYIRKPVQDVFIFRKFGEFNYSQPKPYNQNVLSYTRKFVAEFCLGYPVRNRS
jgi:hypothetical protein